MLCYEYPPIGGGGAKVVYGLTNELSQKECEIDLVTMGYKDLPAFERIGNLNIHRVKCIRVKENMCTFLEMILYIVLAFPVALRLCRKNKYLINHTHFIFPDGILAFLLYRFTGLNYIITAHGSDVPGYNPNRFKLLHKILRPVWNIIVNSTRKIVFPSNSLEEVFRSVNRKIEGIIIPNGINTGRFIPSPKKKKEILVVTRMFERKGVQYILKAFQGLKLDYVLNIVGKGPYLDSLKNLAAELKLDANFLGYIDNRSAKLKALFEESEIFIFTSESENFPIVLLEAMLAGNAIITTNNSGCAEVVGDSALLIEPKNPEAIRNSLIKLVNNPALIRNLQLSARSRVEKFFSWKRVTGQYMELYQNYSMKTNRKKIIASSLKILFILFNFFSCLSTPNFFNT